MAKSCRNRQENSHPQINPYLYYIDGCVLSISTRICKNFPKKYYRANFLVCSNYKIHGFLAIFMVLVPKSCWNRQENSHPQINPYLYYIAGCVLSISTRISKNFPKRYRRASFLLCSNYKIHGFW